MRYLGILICFLLFLAVGSPVATAAVETLISENFEDDAVDSKPPKNEGQPGTWQPGCEILVGATKPSEPSNLRCGLYKNKDSTNSYDMNGYLKSSRKVTAVGEKVHAEIDLRYENGLIAFGIATDATATSPTVQAETALMFLQFQHSTNSLNKHLLARDSNDAFADLGIKFYEKNNPFPEGQSWNKIVIDYIVGDSTAKLSLNGGEPVPVPLRNLGGPVDGFFFIDADHNPSTITWYSFDNLLMTSEPPDPVPVFVPPAPPPRFPTGNRTSEAAVRFLTQATYGATPELIADVKLNGFDDWITRQLKAPPTFTMPIMQGRKIQQTLQDSVRPAGITVTHFFNAWWKASLTGDDQLRQRVAFALSQIFVISQNNDELEYKPLALSNYYDMLLKHAFGNYRELLEQVTLSPAMGAYLDLRGNRKADGEIRPNENYAREILQLFSIGLDKLNPDGTLKLGADGMPIPTYDQDVIIGFARALTGWDYHQKGTDPNPPPDFQRPMTLIPDFHEEGKMPGKQYSKLLFDGITLQPGRSGKQDLQDSLNVVFRHPNVGPFISRQLIQRLVCSNPSPGYIYRVARKFDDNGQGVRGDLGAVVRAILTDYEARSTTLLAKTEYGHLKEPVVRTAQIIRAFKPRSITGDWKISNTDTPLGQTPLRAQTVFNFFSPNFAKSGEVRKAQLVSPEFAITSETTTITAANFIRFGVENGFGSGADIRLDFTKELDLAYNPTTLLNHLNLILMAGQMSQKMKATITSYLSTIPPKDARGRVLAAVALVGISPEYSVQR